MTLKRFNGWSMKSIIAPSLVNKQKLTASDGAAGDDFGFSVAVSGPTIDVAPHKDFLTPSHERVPAYVFERHLRSSTMAYLQRDI